MKIESVLDSVEKYLLYILIAVFPVFVLSVFPSIFITPRLVFLTGMLSLVIILWVIRSVVSGSIHFSVGRFDIAVAAMMIAYLASTLLTKVNKAEVFLFPGVTTFILAGGFLYFLLNQLKSHQKEGVSFALVVSGVLLSLTIILAETQILGKIPGVPTFVKDATFNPLGGVLPTIIYLTVLSSILVLLFMKQKDMAKRAFLGVSAILIVLGLGLSIKNALPGNAQSPRLIGFKTSWEVAIESLKGYPLWGVGSGNYLTAFNRFRPVSYNQSDLWGVRFTSARDFYFTLATEIGLVGLLAISILLFTAYKAKSIPLSLLLVLFVVFPASPVLLVLMFILLALSSASEEKTLDIAGNRAASALASAPLVLGIIAVSYFGARGLLAEFRFKKAINALGSNNAQETYNNLREAVRINPKVDRYHASFAQVDMAIASSLATKKDLTDTDRNTISQLIQHAINEGKLTITLNPTRSGNWEILARIYRSIMPFAKGADGFAIQTFNQAIVMDPVNPNLRIALGGTYYALGRFDEAIETFKLAVLAKPDLANAHYNLAVAYREKKDYQKATDEMNIVLSLVGKDSADYETALKELKNIQELTPPQPVEESAIKPPLELPKEATPPATTQ